MPTSRVGPFALEELLPGAGCVYRAIHVSQKRSVALKLFAAPFGTGREARLAFSSEWEILKSLRHPHLVRCFGGGLEGMQGFLVSELVDGESLAAVLQRRGRISWELVVDYAVQLVQGLEYMHEQNALHLALATDKILLAEDGAVKIADIRFRRDKGSAFLSAKGLTVAAAHYAAPEQFRADAEVSTRTDLYGLGCILYELLTGSPPFTDTTVPELARQHQEDEPERASRLVLDCPVWLDAFVHQLLEKDPARRPHSMAAARLALKRAQDNLAKGMGVAEHVSRGLSPLRTTADRKEAARVLGRNPKKRKRPPAAERPPFYESVWFLSLCLLLLIAGGTWALWPLNEDQLFRRAERLMADGDEEAARRARADYLEPLLRRFPRGEHAHQARDILDRMDMELAERRLRNKLKLGRELGGEAERLLAEAWQFQQFGDQFTALDKFESMIDLLPNEEENRPYRNIARREAAALQGQGNLAQKRREFIQQRLNDADQLVQEGKLPEAERIWRSMVSLYQNHPDLNTLVDVARQRLRTLDDERQLRQQEIQFQDWEP